MLHVDRRAFLHSVAGLGAAGLAPIADVAAWGAEPSLAQPSGGAIEAKLQFGLVTYMWGHDWDLPTLLANCEQAGALGVELRTTHAHGVEPSLSAAERRDVKQRFADSPVALVGLGSNEDFHEVDAPSLRRSIEQAKAFIKLSHDVGGSGVKVKPNDLPPEAPQQRTIEQIGKSLNELGAYAADYGQQVRLEVHGQCAPLPIMAAIMHVADHHNVAVCWNSNPQDLEGHGLAHNFRLVERRLGATVHVRQLAGDQYPYPNLFGLLKGARYNGWILIEGADMPDDRVAALVREREAFEALVSG